MDIGKFSIGQWGKALNRPNGSLDFGRMRHGRGLSLAFHSHTLSAHCATHERARLHLIYPRFMLE